MNLTKISIIIFRCLPYALHKRYEGLYKVLRIRSIL